MPKPFHELTLDEFADLLHQFPFTRDIQSVHMHHTWRPNHADFASRPPLATIEAMYNFHTQVKHWSDIAQHVTVDPKGHIWTGRDWNAPPASATGFNGNATAGPFMFEMIGDFDKGRDPFSGAQKKSVIGLIAALLRKFGLTPDAVRFHNQMSVKSCPGSAIDRKAFLAELKHALDAKPAVAKSRAFSDAAGAQRQRSLTIVANWQANARSLATADEGETTEDAMDATGVAMITGAEPVAQPDARAIFGGGPDFTPDEKQKLRPHVVNLRLGLFSDTGKYTTSLADVQRIFSEFLPAELEKQKSQGQPLRLVFYAHGGLVSEESGIRPCLRRLPFWRGNNMYPIFFCWETGLTETASDIIQSLFKGERGLVSTVTNELLEAAAGAGGREVWGRMKRSAELSSLTGGGARIVAEMTRDFWNEHHKDMEIHAVGHSAGSIFHSFFLPTLLDQKTSAGVPAIKVKTLHYLAPACTTALFKDTLLARIGPGKAVEQHTMYTMNKDLELADKAGPYQASLLYFVSRAFEPVRPTPILGLEENLRDDSALIRLYGLSRTIKGVAQILFSKTPPGAPLDSATQSTTHGDFDNDVATMNSVARRITANPTSSIVSFVDEAGQNEVTRALSATPATSTAMVETSRAPAARAGTRRALCIGIDAYPAPNTLAGCVNDARDWAAALTALGFRTTTLLNQQAKRDGILTAMSDLVSSARAGDVIAIQFAGHGTQVTDVDGDETDGQDEALVPIDFETGAFVIDDDLRAVMLTIPAGVSVTCFMDCCHSGTNTRVFGPTPVTATDGSRPRFMRLTPEQDQAHIAFRSKSRSAPPRRNSSNMREVNFAACRPEQVAYETKGSGDFTRYAMKILKAGIDGLTNKAFQQRVLDAFGPNARQEPFLDCGSGTGAQPLLGGVITSPREMGDDVLSRLDRIEAQLSKLGA